jgi:hypothetical protein
MLLNFGICAEERSVAQQMGGLWFARKPTINRAFAAQAGFCGKQQFAAGVFPEG